MKRPMTLTAGILSVVGAAFSLIVSLIFTIEMGTVLSYGYTEYISIFIISLLWFLLSITTLVFSILAIVSWNKSKEKFQSMKKLNIVAVVMNFVLFVVGIIMLVIGAAYVDWACALTIISMLLAVPAAILLIVDFALEGKRDANAAPVVATAQPQSQEVAAEVAKVSAVISTEAKLAAADEFAQKLAKLDALKKNGLLDEEEYSEIKKSYVKDYLGK